MSVYGHHRQWIDLGVHTEPCMNRPDTCGEAGGAVSLWLKEIACPNVKGMITSRTENGTGFTIYCTHVNAFR